MRIVTPAEFGARLRELRKAKGLNQKEFGDAVSVVQSAVCAWETGSQMPERSRWGSIANELGVDLAALFFDETEAA